MGLVVQTLEAEKKLLSTELERANAKFQDCFQDKCNLSAQLRFAQSNYDTTCDLHSCTIHILLQANKCVAGINKRPNPDAQLCDVGIAMITQHADTHTQKEFAG